MSTGQSNHEHGQLRLTPELLKVACDIVEAGNFRQIAFAHLGIPTGTWKNWLQKGKQRIRDVESGKRDEIGLQGELVLALDKAEARCHRVMLQDVVESENVQAKMWFLERRYNKLYSRNPNAHLDDETGEEVKLNAAEVLMERLRQIMEEQ